MCFQAQQPMAAKAMYHLRVTPSQAAGVARPVSKASLLPMTPQERVLVSRTGLRRRCNDFILPTGSTHVEQMSANTTPRIFQDSSCSESHLHGTKLVPLRRRCFRLLGMPCVHRFAFALHPHGYCRRILIQLRIPALLCCRFAITCVTQSFFLASPSSVFGLHLLRPLNTRCICTTTAMPLHLPLQSQHVSSCICLRKRRADDRVSCFGVQRWLPLANGIGTEHRTRSMHVMYHTFLFVQALIRLNKICQNFEDHIKGL